MEDVIEGWVGGGTLGRHAYTCNGPTGDGDKIAICNETNPSKKKTGKK